MLYPVLFVALALAAGAALRRSRVPAAIVLAGIGVLLGFATARWPEVRVPIRLTPNLLFTFLLPPLLFEAAYRLPAKEVRVVARLIVWLAVPGLLIGVGVASLLLAVGLRALGVPDASRAGWLFAAVTCATDPVAVVVILRQVRAPLRLRVVLDAESLLNDAAAVIVVRVVLALTAVHAATAWGHEGSRALLEIVEGLTIGVTIGELGARVNRWTRAPLFGVATSIVVAYAANLAAAKVGASAILAVVAAGFTFANREPTRMVIIDGFWEYVALGANALVFVLVGFELDVVRFAHRLPLVALAWAAVVVARAVFVALGVALSKKQAERGFQRMLVVGGMRGALSMVLALSLPPSPVRELVVDLTFGVVALTLFVHGLLLALLRRQKKTAARPR